MRGEGAAPPARLAFVDALRGVAIAAMAVYHFSWDLRYFGFIAADVAAEPGWRLFARAIAGSFLLLVGVSLVLSTRRRFDRGRFLRRLAMVAGAAAAITAVTFIVFPQAYIFFGILHHIALASVLGLVFLRAPLLLVIAAAGLCLAAPWLLADPAFDRPALIWLGLGTTIPRSNDFVPVFPWFGIVLAGIALARLALLYGPPPPAFAPRPLAWAGRHSLAIYLVHQPLLFGLVALAAQVAPPPRDAVFMQSCTGSCVATDAGAAICRRICDCLAERAKAEDLWAGILDDTLTDAQRGRYFDLAATCQADTTE